MPPDSKVSLVILSDQKVHRKINHVPHISNASVIVSNIESMHLTQSPYINIPGFSSLCTSLEAPNKLWGWLKNNLGSAHITLIEQYEKDIKRFTNYLGTFPGKVLNIAQ